MYGALASAARAMVARDRMKNTLRKNLLFSRIYGRVKP